MPKFTPPAEPQAGTPASDSVHDTDIPTMPQPDEQLVETQFLTGIKLVLMTASLTTIAFIMMLNASVVATVRILVLPSPHSIHVYRLL